MDKSWIKLYRKSKDNYLMRDFTAWGIFCWILLTVDRRTGTMTLGRKWASEYFGIPASTFYGALKRLEKRYEVVTLTTGKQTIKYTVVTVKKWHLYQGTDIPEDNQPTINRQSTDTYTRIENREVENTNVVAIKSPISKKKPSPLQETHRNIIDYYQTVTGAKVVNWASQAKAIKSMLSAGYEEKHILRTIDYMANKDAFYSDKGFDLITVAKQIAIYKASSRKEAKKYE